MAEISRCKPAGETIDYQELDNITFNPEFVTILAGHDQKDFTTLSSNKPLNDENSTDISYITIQSTEIPLHRSVSWEIHWKEPSFIACMLFAGLILSLAHHFYYMSLSDKRTGDEIKQAWPTRIGTGLAFLVTSCLKAATTASLGQYIWKVMKRQPLTMKSLDRLFALSTDPLALFSVELLKGAKLALLLGAITWLLGLASVAPPATLTIIAKNISQEVHLPVLDFSKPIWNDSMSGDWNAVSVTNTIAINTASNINVLGLARQVSGSEWSYSLQFYGPSLQCNEPNITQKALFDNITRYYEQDNIFTYDDRHDNQTNATFGQGSGKLLYASWSTWYASGTPNTNYGNLPPPFQRAELKYPQLWVQTSTSEIVCTAVNASFHIGVSYIDGVQHVTQQSIEIIGDYNLYYADIGEIQGDPTITDSNGVITTSATGGSAVIVWNEYLPHIYSLGGILGGNITLRDNIHDNSESVQQYVGYGDSNILGTGLMACDEIANSPFKYEKSSLIRNVSATFTNTFSSTTQPWLCRNRTLARGIEDLANNITISFLSSPYLTSDGNLQNIVTSNTNNYYVYDPLWLAISYGLALFFSAIAVTIGAYAINSNGVVHSNSFSAIVATTQNPELGEFLGRSSLGADPMKTNSPSRRLKFGPILNQTTTDNLDAGGGESGVIDEKIPHVAFGLEQNIGELRKRKLYI